MDCVWEIREPLAAWLCSIVQKKVGKNLLKRNCATSEYYLWKTDILGVRDQVNGWWKIDALFPKYYIPKRILMFDVECLEVLSHGSNSEKAWSCGRRNSHLESLRFLFCLILIVWCICLLRSSLRDQFMIGQIQLQLTVLLCQVWAVACCLRGGVESRGVSAWAKFSGWE